MNTFVRIEDSVYLTSLCTTPICYIGGLKKMHISIGVQFVHIRKQYASISFEAAQCSRHIAVECNYSNVRNWAMAQFRVASCQPLNHGNGQEAGMMDPYHAAWSMWRGRWYE